MTYSNVFFGVSNHTCNNRKLFEFKNGSDNEISKFC